MLGNLTGRRTAFAHRHQFVNEFDPLEKPAEVILFAEPFNIDGNALFQQIVRDDALDDEFIPVGKIECVLCAQLVVLPVLLHQQIIEMRIPAQHKKGKCVDRPRCEKRSFDGRPGKECITPCPQQDDENSGQDESDLPSPGRFDLLSYGRPARFIFHALNPADNS